MKLKVNVNFLSIWSLTVICCLFLSCEQNVKEYTDIKREQFPNGKRIIVEKINKETTSVGIFTKHNYSTKHSFTYKFTIDPMNVTWKGGSGEPKKILFAQDTIYLYYLKSQSEKVEFIDSLSGESDYYYKDVIEKHYGKYIDERYFFRLFGDDYWLNITPDHYLIKKAQGNEFSVPNDDELVFKERK